jgi:hypothetical protein
VDIKFHQSAHDPLGIAVVIDGKPAHSWHITDLIAAMNSPYVVASLAESIRQMIIESGVPVTIWRVGGQTIGAR